jgi:hypothetical protein
MVNVGCGRPDIVLVTVSRLEASEVRSSILYLLAKFVTYMCVRIRGCRHDGESFKLRK